MSNIFYPNDPRRRYQRARGVGTDQRPTVEDFERLATAYRELKERHEQQVATIEQQTKTLEQQAKQISELQNELAVKNEALHRQSADLKQTEADLLWTRAALEQAQKELSEARDEGWRDKYLALQAEVENLRKRWEQRYSAEINEARNRILADMLPLADHLDLALQHADAVSEPEGQAFIENIKTTRRAFLETLKRYGVERMEAQDQPFDPNLHEAVGYIVAAQTPRDHISQVVQNGYLNEGRVLRPARVVVSKGAGDEVDR